MKTIDRLLSSFVLSEDNLKCSKRIIIEKKTYNVYLRAIKRLS